MNESINDALIECVKALGGSKSVGVALWPAKGIDAAQRHLLSCLNPDRPEKLGPDEVVQVLRLARERGCHAGMQYLAAELGYAEPQPVEPKDQADELCRQVLAMGSQITRALAKLEQLERPVVSRVA